MDQETSHVEPDLAAMLKRLSRQQQNFCWLLAMEGNASRARLRAGFKDQGCPARNAHEAYRLLQKPHIRETADAVRQSYLASLSIDAERILLELSYIAFADLTDLVGQDGRLLVEDPRRLPPEVRRSVREIRQKTLHTVRTSTGAEGGDPEVEETIEIIQTTVKLEPKTAALRMLAGGLVERMKDLISPPESDADVDPDDLTDAELARLARNPR